MPSTEKHNMAKRPDWLAELMAKYEQPPDDLLTVKELADLTGISRSQVPRYIEKIGIKMARLRKHGRVQYCVTKEQTKLILDQMVKDGYLIKKHASRQEETDG
jgi:excisionase family DNA binding protein